MGEAKRRKQSDPNFGKPKPKSLEEIQRSLNTFDEEGSIYDDDPQLAEHVAELQAANMTLEQFKKEFSKELDIIQIKSDVVLQWANRGEPLQSYQGKVLAVRYRGKDGPEEMFAFPNADDPKAPVPPDVFDYLASFWAS